MRWKVILRRDGICELWSRGVLVIATDDLIGIFEFVAGCNQAVPA